MSSPDENLDALRRLASDRREGTAGDVKPAPRTSGAAKSTSEVEDLASVLSGRANVSSAQPSRRTLAAPNAMVTNESLEQLVRTSSAEQPRAVAAAKANDVAHEGIEALAHPVSPARERPAVQPKATAQHALSTAPADFRQDQLANILQTTPASSIPSRFGFQIKLPLKHVVIALFLLLGAALAIYQHQPGKMSYPSPLATQVAQLAAAVDAHYAKNGNLPATLTELGAFPPDALQWPVENYGLHLMDRRTEFFFDGVSGDDYFVIGRSGAEAWIFAKEMKPELQQVPAY